MLYLSSIAADLVASTDPERANGTESRSKLKELVRFLEPNQGCLKGRDEFSLYIFPSDNRLVLIY